MTPDAVLQFAVVWIVCLAVFVLFVWALVHLLWELGRVFLRLALVPWYAALDAWEWWRRKAVSRKQ